jgi:fructokinase
VNVISIGEVLWDVVGQDEHLGGAPFNFAAHLARLGHHVSFVSAVGADERGERILEAMPHLGLSTRYVRRLAEYPTGAVTVSLDNAGHPDYLIRRPAAYDFPRVGEEDLAELFTHPVDWIYFGTLLQMSPAAKRVTTRLLDAGKGTGRFYDVNLRQGCWAPSLVRELMAKATMVKLNADEAAEVARMFGQPLASPLGSLEKFCRACAARFAWDGVCITRGADGCALLLGDEYVEASGYAVQVADTVGAGDAFAAALVHGVGSGWPSVRAADFANRVGALVASRPGAVPTWTPAEVEALQPAPDCRSDPQSQARETA